jgi:hypothetical protein
MWTCAPIKLGRFPVSKLTLGRQPFFSALAFCFGLAATRSTSQAHAATTQLRAFDRFKPV